MSEYYLAEQKTAERTRQRARESEREMTNQPEAADIRLTLLGESVFATTEPKGCDPYNSAHGSPPHDVWHTSRNRR